MLLSLSGFLFQTENPAEQLDFLAFCSLASSIGYDGVELRRTQVDPKTSKTDRKSMLNIVKDMGLAVTCLTARRLPPGGKERDDFFESYLDLCNDMECGLMKIGSDTAWCREAAMKAEARGVTLASNNHGGGQLETVQGTREFLSSVDHPNFGLLYDCMHLMANGQDYLGCIPEFVKFTKNILIQSRRPIRAEEKSEIAANSGDWKTAFPDEDGVQNWPGVFRRFRQQGYNGLVTVIENSWPAERREEVARKCCLVLREMWSAAGN